MTIGTQEELDRLLAVGGVVASTLRAMGALIEPGRTTQELDDAGAKLLEDGGAESAPVISVGFPGATCISINNEIAHGVPGERRIEAGDLVNIDVSAKKDGYFADSGASFMVPPTSEAQEALCRTTRKALHRSIKAVRAGVRLNVIGQTISRVARQSGYTVIRNLHSHGVGAALHEAPSIPPYHDRQDRRRLHEGLVFTIEPFLSTGAEWADQGDDGWTLTTPPAFMTAQYEHSLVVTRRGAIVLTR
ncbi:MAG: type I methionyl aminopeptidase [Alphaproteobacteria bacterium]